MKTLKIAFVVTLNCLFLLTGCAEDPKRMEVSHVESLEEEISDLDELIRKSDNIVVGTVTDEEQFISKGQPDKFTFTVKNELKGNVEEESIDVYEFPGGLEKGKEYILFLSYWESALYPKPVYTSINKNSLIEVKRNKLIGGKFIGSKKKDEFIQYIKSSKEVNVFSEMDYDVIDKAKDLGELISLSDLILHIVPKEIDDVNVYVTHVVNAEIIQTLKGQYNNERLSLLLPPNIDLEKEYIVFLKKDDGLTIATREGSVVSKDDEALWQEILNELAK